MRKIESIAGVLDWIIRLQGSYTILATLVAGGLGTIVRAILKYHTAIPPLWITPIWVFTSAVLLIVLFIFGSRLGSFVNYPDFQLVITTIIWIYDEQRDQTRIYLGARLLNRGAPSITQAWTAKYIVGTTEEDMTGFYLVGPSILTIGNERLTVTNDDLLIVKTAERAIERGGAIYGRLLFTVPGDRDAQIKSLQFKIEVKVQDYTSREYSAVYVPSPKPLSSLLRHPFEKAEVLKVQSGPTEATALPTDGNGKIVQM